MRVSPRTALWPQLVAISLIGLGAAGCAENPRFSDLFGSTGSTSAAIPAQSASPTGIEAKPLPHLASAEDGFAGSGAGGYQSQTANGAAHAGTPHRAPAAAP